MKALSPAERLYVEADGLGGVVRGRPMHRLRVLELANQIKDTHVGIKVGSVLSSSGYGLLGEIGVLNLPYWADLNLSGDADNLAMSAAFLFELRPDIVTVSGMASLAAMRAVRMNLVGAEVIGNTSLEGFTRDEVVSRFNCDPVAATLQMARSALAAGFDGWVATPDFGKLLKMQDATKTLTFTNVRPTWSIGSHEDARLIMTPERAFGLGADRIVVGGPIVDAADQEKAVMMTLREIAMATA